VWLSFRKHTFHCKFCISGCDSYQLCSHTAKLQLSRIQNYRIKYYHSICRIPNCIKLCVKPTQQSCHHCGEKHTVNQCPATCPVFNDDVGTYHQCIIFSDWRDKWISAQNNKLRDRKHAVYLLRVNFWSLWTEAIPIFLHTGHLIHTWPCCTSCCVVITASVV
jgi:hypothetical protein